MRIAALIVGIIGSIAAFAGALFALFFGAVGTAIDAEGGAEVTGLGFGALLMSIVALVGAALAMGKPRLAAALMAISAVAGLILVSFAYVLGTVLLLIAALLAFLARNEKRAS